MVRSNASFSPPSPSSGGNVEMSSLVNDKSSKASTILNTVRSRSTAFLRHHKKASVAIGAILGVGFVFSGEFVLHLFPN